MVRSLSTGPSAAAATTKAGSGSASSKGVVSNHVPLLIPKVMKSKSILIAQIDDPGELDVLGDAGIIGSITANDTRGASSKKGGKKEDGSGLVMDLKGGRHEGTMLRCNTLMVVSIGAQEAKVESMVSEFCRLGKAKDMLQQMRGVLSSSAKDGGRETAATLRNEGASSDEAGNEMSDSDDDDDAKKKKKKKTTKKKTVKKQPAKRKAGGGTTKAKPKAAPKKGKAAAGAGGAAGGAKKRPARAAPASKKPKKKARKKKNDSEEDDDDESFPENDSDSDFCP